jgi:hypothetical protein
MLEDAGGVLGILDDDSDEGRQSQQQVPAIRMTIPSKPSILSGRARSASDRYPAADRSFGANRATAFADPEGAGLCSLIHRHIAVGQSRSYAEVP